MDMKPEHEEYGSVQADTQEISEVRKKEIKERKLSILLSEVSKDSLPCTYDKKSIVSLAEYNVVQFPSVLLNHPILLCQVHLTSLGLFVFGLSELDKSQIKALEVQVATETFGLGLIGALTSETVAKKAKEIHVNALNTYQENREAIEGKSLRSRFDQAPYNTYYIRTNDVINISFPEKKEKIRIETAFGELEFVETIQSEEIERLREWWKNVQQYTYKEEEICWTLPKVLLYYRKNKDISISGLAACFCQSLTRSGQVGNGRRLLRSALFESTYWSFLSELRVSEAENADEIVRVALFEEKNYEVSRLFFALCLAMTGAISSYVAEVTLHDVYGTAGAICGVVFLVGIGCCLYGIVRIIVSIIRIVRCLVAKGR